MRLLLVTASRVWLRFCYARMQVFVVDLVWDNDERYEIVRRYSEFFTLQVKGCHYSFCFRDTSQKLTIGLSLLPLQESLKSVFPDAVHGGKKADERTTLPELPGAQNNG